MWLQESDSQDAIVDSSCLEEAAVADRLDTEADIDILGKRVVGSHILVAARTARRVPEVAPGLCNLVEADIW